MNALTQPKPDSAVVLGKAVARARDSLGLPQETIAEMLGVDRSRLYRNPAIKPESKRGELAMLFVRAYRGLFALVGGHEETMRHWMRTRNRHLSGVPAELIRSAEGLVSVVQYLDAMRGNA